MVVPYAEWKRRRAQQHPQPIRHRGIEVVRRYKAGEPLDKLAQEYKVHEVTILRLVRCADIIAHQLSMLASRNVAPK